MGRYPAGSAGGNATASGACLRAVLDNAAAISASRFMARNWSQPAPKRANKATPAKAAATITMSRCALCSECISCSRCSARDVDDLEPVGHRLRVVPGRRFGFLSRLLDGELGGVPLFLQLQVGLEEAVGLRGVLTGGERSRGRPVGFGPRHDLRCAQDRGHCEDFPKIPRVLSFHNSPF